VIKICIGSNLVGEIEDVTMDEIYGEKTGKSPVRTE
jgi:hypothetical protein